LSALDYIVLLLYVVGMFVVASVFSSKIHDADDLVNAGRQSPWWVAGLSGFMTMFSAATFVIWGGIAYRYGLVAIVINLTYGVAALLVGFFVAGRWRRLGLATPAEFIELRYGRAALNFYTLVNLVYRMVSVGVSLYAIAVIASSLMPVEKGFLFADATSGCVSTTWIIVAVGIIVTFYTMLGGLWAVLMTDVVQFIVLTASVAIVAPLILLESGGASQFVASAPQGFFLPTAGDWTWFVLVAWCATQFFTIGAEWAFVQRYLCVPGRRDAKKAAWLFGVLYLSSPVLWMIPPMVYRTIDPTADPERAYILACQSVLPTGMVGLLLAAMFSATASIVDSQLNVFAGVLLNDIYRPLFRPQATQAHLVRVGRTMILALGCLLVVLGVAVPAMGGAEDVIVKIASLVVVPLLLPTIWGLLSRKVGVSAVWLTAAISFLFGGTVQIALAIAGKGVVPTGWEPTLRWVRDNGRAADMLAGVVVPVLVMIGCEFFARRSDEGWNRIASRPEPPDAAATGTWTRLPARITGWSVVACGALMTMVLPWADEGFFVLVIYAATLWTLGIVILISSRDAGGLRGILSVIGCGNNSYHTESPMAASKSLTTEKSYGASEK